MRSSPSQTHILSVSMRWMQHPTLRVSVLCVLLITPIFVSCDSGGNSSGPEGSVEVVVTGTVTSNSGAPIEEASIDVQLPDDGTSLASTSTDGTGAYETTFVVFEENAPDQVQLTFAAAEFMNEDVIVDFGTEIQRDITLEAITPKSLGSEPKTILQQDTFQYQATSR